MRVLKSEEAIRTWARECAADDLERLAELSPSEKPRPREAAACLRALALVGGEHALEVMGRYATLESLRGDGFDNDDTFAAPITKALKFAWDRFDRAAFAATMFGPHDALTMIDGPNFESVEGLEAAGLGSFEGRVTARCDLEPLARCALQRLSIINNPGIDDKLIALLPKLKTVERLEISFIEFDSLYCLLDMSALTNLKLGVHLVWETGMAPEDNREIEPQPAAVLRELVQRGVMLELRPREHWTERAEEVLADCGVLRHGSILRVYRRATNP